MIWEMQTVQITFAVKISWVEKAKLNLMSIKYVSSEGQEREEEEQKARDNIFRIKVLGVE